MPHEAIRLARRSAVGSSESGSVATLRPWVVAFSEAVRIPAAVLGPVDLLALALLARRFLGLVMLGRLELHGAKVTAQEFVIELHALDVELAVDEHLV